MFVVVTQEQAEQQRKAQDEMFARMVRDGMKKAEEKRQWVEAITCPHCGHCPTFPGDLA